MPALLYTWVKLLKFVDVPPSPNIHKAVKDVSVFIWVIKTSCGKHPTVGSKVKSTKGNGITSIETLDDTAGVEQSSFNVKL